MNATITTLTSVTPLDRYPKVEGHWANENANTTATKPDLVEVGSISFSLPLV